MPSRLPLQGASPPAAMALSGPVGVFQYWWCKAATRIPPTLLAPRRWAFNGKLWVGCADFALSEGWLEEAEVHHCFALGTWQRGVVGGLVSVRKFWGPHICEGSRAGLEYKPPHLDGEANALSNNTKLHRPPNLHLRSRLASCVCGLPEAWARPLLQFRAGLHQFRFFGGLPRPRDPFRSNRKVSL